MATYYQMDFPDLVAHLVPVRLRKAITLSWLQCLVQPVLELYNKFTAFRDNNIYTLLHNSQVVFMEAALNDVFDNFDRGIYITDGSAVDPLFVYLNAENLPLWLGLNSEAGTTFYPDPQWLFKGSETTFHGYDFLVMVPATVTYNHDQMNALIDKYRLPSRSSYLVLTY